MEMKNCIGVKRIKASREMSRQEYYDYRGWKLPENEDGNDRVYLVEYEKDASSKPNHPDHEGYVSMSPKGVFDKAYLGINTVIPEVKDLKPFQQRVVEEARELSNKTLKLQAFLKRDKAVEGITDKDIRLLKQQLNTMFCYLTVLVTRIENFKEALELKEVTFEEAVKPIEDDGWMTLQERAPFVTKQKPCQLRYMTVPDENSDSFKVINTVDMTYGAACFTMEFGNCIARKGWNGSDMFVCKQVTSTLDSSIIAGMTSLPKSAKDLLLATSLEPIRYENQMILVKNSKTGVRIINSWVASSSDTFAKDWYIVNKI